MLETVQIISLFISLFLHTASSKKKKKEAWSSVELLDTAAIHISSIRFLHS